MTSSVRQIGHGVYRVEHDGISEIVYVAGPPGSRWAFWRGRVYTRVETSDEHRRPTARGHVVQSLTAPMPATVIRVLVKPGDLVKKGDTVVLLEAMKMELPVRAAGDATVKTVNCREGQLVQPETVLVVLE
jgi:biotin carboxyl carrier protein